MLWIGGAVLAAVLAVFIAWQLGAREGRIEKERVQAELDDATLRLNLLEARRLLHQAILQLEARNFGSAQERAERATQFLSASRTEATDATQDDVTGDALARLQEFRTSVDPNVGQQIATLVQISRGLDEGAPAPDAPHGFEGPAAADEQLPADPDAAR